MHLQISDPWDKYGSKNYPGKKPQTVWRSKRIKYYNVDDDVN
jgi:hypothetical protein